MTVLSPAECEVKWKAMLEGLDSSQRTVVGWLLEQEIRFLAGELDSGGEPRHPVGERARVHLPVLRLAACRLLPESAVEQLGRVASWPQSLTTEEVYAELREAYLRIAEVGGPVMDWNPGEIGVGPQIKALAERTYKGLLAYPGSES